MKLSARNQWPGEVVAVNEGPAPAEVALRLDAGDDIVATITTGSARALALRPGSRVNAVVKASDVILTGDRVASSARNQLVGRVSGIERGAVQGVVSLRSDRGTDVAASVTLASIDRLGLADDAPVTALIKASHVLIAVD